MTLEVSDQERIEWLREEITRLHKMIERRDEEIHRLLGQIRLQAIYMVRYEDVS